MLKALAGAAAGFFGLGQSSGVDKKYEVTLRNLDADIQRILANAEKSTTEGIQLFEKMAHARSAITSQTFFGFPEMGDFHTIGKGKEAKIPPNLAEVYNTSAILMEISSTLQDMWICAQGDKKTFGQIMKSFFKLHQTVMSRFPTELIEDVKSTLISGGDLKGLPLYSVLCDAFKATVPLLEDMKDQPSYVLSNAFKNTNISVANIVLNFCGLDEKLLSSIVAVLPEHTKLTSDNDLLKFLLSSGNHRFFFAMLGDFGLRCVNAEIGILDRLVEKGFSAPISQIRTFGSGRCDLDVLAMLPPQSKPMFTPDGKPVLDSKGNQMSEWVLAQADSRCKLALRNTLKDKGELDITFVGIHQDRVVASSKGGINITHLFAILTGMCPMPSPPAFLELLAAVLKERIEGLEFLLSLFVGKNLHHLKDTLIVEEYKGVRMLEKDDPNLEDFKKESEAAKKQAQAMLLRACEGNATQKDISILLPLLLSYFSETASPEEKAKLCKSITHILALLNGDCTWTNEGLILSMTCSEEAKKALRAIFSRENPDPQELGALVEFFRQEFPRIPF